MFNREIAEALWLMMDWTERTLWLANVMAKVDKNTPEWYEWMQFFVDMRVAYPPTV